MLTRSCRRIGERRAIGRGFCQCLEVRLAKAKAWGQSVGGDGALWEQWISTRSRSISSRSASISSSSSRRSIATGSSHTETEEGSERQYTIRDVGKEPSLLETFTPDRIRNYCVIAHIDHGKSTLADGLLVRTGNITEKERAGKTQQMDTLKVERERGITVKAQTASMLYKGYLLNLIDTPGHVDFSHEVVRSLSACNGALLLVDSSQGVQAQTLSTCHAAIKAGLSLIPVLTKIDLPHAQPEDVAISMSSTFDLDPEKVIETSAKAGVGIEEVLDAIIEQVPPPGAGSKPHLPQREQQTRCRLVDSWFDQVRGVVCLIQVVDGCLSEGQRITTCALRDSKEKSGKGIETFNVQELGLLTPTPMRTTALFTGQVGYMVSGMRSTRQAIMGDTVIIAGDKTQQHQRQHEGGGEPPPEPLPMLAPSRCAVFASVFPSVDGEFDALLQAVERLALNDASLVWEREQNLAMGSGLRVGFLGLLHMEVFHQRLTDEFDTSVLLTSPTVPYLIKEAAGAGGGEDQVREVLSLADWPASPPKGQQQQSQQAGGGPVRLFKFKVLEPMVEATVVTPATCLGAVMGLLKDRRGVQKDMKYLDEHRVVLRYDMPWQEIVTDFHDAAKTVSSGYASFDFKEIPHQEADLVKVDMVVNDEVVDALSFVCHRDKAEKQGRAVCHKLKDVIPRQQFAIAIQARIGSKNFARETVKPYRKDVLTKGGKTMGGGDVSRKKKLLEAQKKGKKEQKGRGKVRLSQEAFWAVLSRGGG